MPIILNVAVLKLYNSHLDMQSMRDKLKVTTLALKKSELSIGAWDSVLSNVEYLSLEDSKMLFI